MFPRPETITTNTPKSIVSRSSTSTILPNFFLGSSAGEGLIRNIAATASRIGRNPGNNSRSGARIIVHHVPHLISIDPDEPVNWLSRVERGLFGIADKTV